MGSQRTLVERQWGKEAGKVHRIRNREQGSRRGGGGKSEEKGGPDFCMNAGRGAFLSRCAKGEPNKEKVQNREKGIKKGFCLCGGNLQLEQ